MSPFVEETMRIGLFGFPLTGKSTLFRLLTGSNGNGAGRGEARVGVTRVPDVRLATLSAIYSPKKATPATIEYLDLAGIEKGEAAQALPLDRLRAADALAHVVRGFDEDALPHAEGSVDPARDVATMETELLLADHGVVEKRIEKLQLQIKKTNRDEEKRELALLERCLDALEAETPLRELELTADEAKILRGYTFLSLKPLLVVVNAGEAEASKVEAGPAAFGLEAFAARPNVHVAAMSARIEAEIGQLDAEHAEEFRADLGVSEPALDRMIRASYDLLGRMSFFTVGEDECRAWTIRRGTPAQRAAAAIHSDIERGFIRAEVIGYDDLVAGGSWSACRDAGTLRLEGKQYTVADGDVINFRFNV